jgi:hypothetical protein
MTYIDRAFAAHGAPQGGAEPEQRSREPLILVVEDDLHLSDALRLICACLNVTIERMPSRDDLTPALRAYRPMAVVAEIDAVGQDGCHVLMTVADYDRTLPVLLLTSADPALLGAVDAVEEIWQLTSVTKWPELGGVGNLDDFLSHAGRKGHCMRLLRA